MPATLYTAATPNGWKISIALEEMGLPYEVRVIDFATNEQKADWYVKLNPNGRIPTLVDDGFAMFESGAILIYLAEKTGKFLPRDVQARSRVIQWLMFQMASVGPMLGQAHHFRRYAPEKLEYAINRYTNEAKRIYGVIDKRLGEAKYLAGDYSIADIATYPWLVVGFPAIKAAKADVVGEGASVARWLAAVGARPAVKKGMQVPKV